MPFSRRISSLTWIQQLELQILPVSPSERSSFPSTCSMSDAMQSNVMSNLAILFSHADNDKNLVPSDISPIMTMKDHVIASVSKVPSASLYWARMGLIYCLDVSIVRLQKSRMTQ